MRIYLIKTTEYSEQDFLDVKEILNSHNGPMLFEHDLTDFSNDFKFLQWFDENFKFRAVKPSKKTIYDSKRGNPLSWREFFGICNKFRTVKHISDDDFVVLLTSRRNSLNWFSSFEQGKRNIFVHTGDWEHFIKAHHKYPVAYEVISSILYVLFKMDLDNIDEYVHKFPLGCISDMCEQKSQVILKLRTGDICQTCLDRLIAENVEPALINQALNLFENIRKQTLFRQGFQNNNKISRLKITNDFRFFLLDYGNLEINLTPRQKALYYLFLRHPEGIRFAELIDYKNEIWDYYKSISPFENLDTMQSSIEKLYNPEDKSTLNTECSRIKSAFRDKIGNAEASIFEQYLIIGDRDEKKRISLKSNYLELPI
ncbi:MAG: hypothetical protein R3D00_05355 [Bacteroidia bacterium]